MNIRGIARIGACLLTLVVEASSQNFQPLSARFDDIPMGRIDRPTMGDAAQKQLHLAGDYMAGRGVPKNAENAAYWYRRAADQGSPEAQNQLGFLYLSGVGVQPDDVQAFKWFARAAGSGFQPANKNRPLSGGEVVRPGCPPARSER